jgi:16S rRNA (guanine966-N2)-methyltransferase
MRIIAGRFRRRKLFTNPGLTTRPITDRVKETLFERISQSCQGARIADIFAGTGTIGLEALSRGGASVVFIEQDRIALELLRQNLTMLACEEQALVWPADVRRCSFRPKGGNERFLPYDLIFFDPPYKLVPDMLRNSPLWLAVRRLGRRDVSSDKATLVLRTPEHARFELAPPWRVDWTLEMSNMVVSVCRKDPALLSTEAADLTDAGEEVTAGTDSPTAESEIPGNEPAT